ncbi:MAG TPA: LptA/OstA family protein [Bryobacteraceae bacterium]|jgi:lipopolysaccharide export system protein LptA|nr:LptA/OstA family protein [Bryobacteraceae bacterium]
MRGTRWLLLVAIAAIIFGVGVTYQRQKKIVESKALAPPPSLPAELSSTTHRGSWVVTDQKTGCKSYEISSQDMRQASDSSHSELSGVELHIFHKSSKNCDSKFDLVRSDAATYFDSEGRMKAEGVVHITLGEPAEGEPPANLIGITCAGVTFDTNSGHADTDGHCDFEFKNGHGESTGATYDPPTRELLMKNDVVVDWQPASPHAKPLHIVAPSLRYSESAAEIDLMPTGSMTRGDMSFEGEKPTIHLREGGEGHKFIKEIDAEHARGADETPGKHLKYSADHAWVFYNDDHLIQRIVVEGNAAMTSQGETSETQVNAHHVEMFFDPHDKESQLDHVVCNGNAVLTSKPLAAPGKTPADSHVLRAENIDLKMRPGGKEIQTVSAHPAGTLEFLPNQPVSHHRTLVGENMLISYGPKNHIDAFHATHVTTTTDPTIDEKKHNRAVSKTSSNDLLARFEPNSSQLADMQQTGSFTYQEGDRKAHADQASFDQKQNVMNLDGAAQVSDATGTTAADHIRLDQRTDDFLANGNVASTRLPDKSQKNDSSMLAGDAPMNAEAQKMESSNRAGNHRTRYQGGARVWQGANRISAETIEIDRDKHTLLADGNVVTEAWQQPKDDSKKKNAAPVLTKVYAPHLVYTDQDRLAYYSGGVRLDRPDLHLKSQELHTWLADSKADSQLEKAVADGAVEISGARRENSYTGNSDHMEYYTAEQKVILNGGAPQLVRTVAGRPPTVVRQRELIYFVNDGKLVGTGAASDRIPAKKK